MDLAAQLQYGTERGSMGWLAWQSNWPSWPMLATKKPIPLLRLRTPRSIEEGTSIHWLGWLTDRVRMLVGVNSTSPLPSVLIGAFGLHHTIVTLATFGLPGTEIEFNSPHRQHQPQSPKHPLNPTNQRVATQSPFGTAGA